MTPRPPEAGSSRASARGTTRRPGSGDPDLAQELLDQIERLTHAGEPHLRAPDVAVAGDPVQHTPVAAGGEVDEAGGLVLAVAARAGDAGDRDAEPTRPALGDARDHGAGDLLAHRAVGVDQGARHAEQLGLGLVGIGDNAAVDDVRRSRNRGQRAADQAAGARFGRHQHDTLAPAGVEHATGEIEDRVVEHHSTRETSQTPTAAKMPAITSSTMTPQPSGERRSAKLIGQNFEMSNIRKSTKPRTEQNGETAGRDERDHLAGDLVDDDGGQVVLCAGR